MKYVYKGLKGNVMIPTDDLIPKTRHGRNQHSLVFLSFFLSSDTESIKF